MSAENRKQEGSTEPTPPTVQVVYRAQLVNEPTQTEGEKKSNHPPKLQTLPSLVTEPQLQHFQDLGLGKGSTSPTPSHGPTEARFKSARLLRISSPDLTKEVLMRGTKQK